MLSSISVSDTKRPAWVRCVSHAAMLCGVFGTLLFTTGCPFLGQAGCTTNAGCTGGKVCNTTTGACVDCLVAADCADDGDACTAESCGANHTCSSSPITGCCVANADCDDTDPCTDDACVDNNCANTATSCDDGDDCTDDACDPATGCASTPMVCNADAVCVGGVCVQTCAQDSDCGDGDVCTTDTCVDGACSNTASCDDGVACTTDGCNPTTGACTNANNCPAGQQCNADGTCASAVACTTNANCPDDGLFCTGVESCNTTTGFCTSTEPCTALQTCNEDLNSCVNPPGATIAFTLGTDNLAGTGGDDTFTAALIFNAPTGTNVPAFQTGDAANGGDGNDKLNPAQLNFGAVTTVAPTLTSIETLNFTDFGTAATTIAGGGITGTTAINLSNSTNANVLTINNLPTLANLGLTNQVIGATIVFQTAATSGSTDAMTLSVNGLTGAATTATITSGTTNGVETLTVNSSGAASSFADIAMNGTTLTTINVSGDAALTITTSLDANVTTVSASGATGGVNLTQTNAGNFTFTGGAGNDTILLGGTYGSTDTLNGAGGSDTLGANTAQLGGTTGNQTNVTNFEGLRIADAHTTALNISHFGSINTVTMDVGSNAGTITNASTGLAINNGARATDPAGAGTLGVTVAGSATTDTATYTLNDCDQTGAVTFTGVETLNLVSNLDLDGSAAAGGTAGVNTLGAALILTDTAALEKVVITGTESLTITGAITANEVTASGFNEPFIMGAAMTLAGVTVTGGAGNDTLFGSAGNDIINAGAGNDIINHMAGNDLVTGGAGADIFRQASAAANGADRQTITDFDDTPTSGDVFNLNSGLATLTGTDNFATAAAIQTHSTAGNLAVTAAAEVVRVTTATVTDFTSANSLNGTNLLTAIGGTITGAIAGQNNILICVADANGNVGVYYASSADNAIIAAEITLVGVLQGANVLLANLVFNNFTNGA